MSATRNDNAGRMKGALCRGEFFEVVLRLASIRCPKGGKMSDHLPIFIEDQMTATLKDSEILNVRKRIRSNDAINQLLWDNKALLQKLHFHFKCKKHKVFTYSSIEKLFDLLNEVDEKQC